MSDATLWYDMYKDISAQLLAIRRDLLDQLSEERTRNFQLAAQRKTMIFHLRMLCDVVQNHNPAAGLPALIRQHILDWENELGQYAAQSTGKAGRVDEPLPRHPLSANCTPLHPAAAADPFDTAKDEVVS